MRLRLIFFLMAAMAMPICSEGQEGLLPRATPESQGVPSASVAAWFDTLMATRSTEIHGAMLLRHGKVVGEMHPSPFGAEHGHALFSCSKTFTAAAVGIAIGENRLRESDRVAAIFADLLAHRGISDTLAALTVGDLLTMRTGIRPTNTIREREAEWLCRYLETEKAAMPGERFAYDSMATYALSAIVSRVTGMNVLEYLRERVFGPLGIDEAAWDSSPEGVTCGGWGLHLRTESMAKFGQLLLNRGAWGSRQLIPSEWVDKMMTVHVESAGYGLQMWECGHESAMRADGLHGQFIIVMPGEDMVAVVTQCCNSKEPGQKEMAALFRDVVPTLSDHALPESKAAKALAKKAAAYALPMAKGSATKGKNARHLGELTLMGDNKLGWEKMTIGQEGDELVVDVVKKDGTMASLRLGNGRWASTQVPIRFPPHSRGKVAGANSGFASPFTARGSYGWEGSDTLNAKILFVDWISGVEIRIDFGEEETWMLVKQNIDPKPFRIKLK